MAYPGRQNIYNAVIRKMVTEALGQEEQEFRTVHQCDSDAELLQYLRSCAQQLHHTPWPREIIGGSFLVERFGSWKRALILAKLPEPVTDDKVTTFLRVRKETERQKEIYKQRKAEKKLQSAKRRAEQERKKLPD